MRKATPEPGHRAQEPKHSPRATKLLAGRFALWLSARPVDNVGGLFATFTMTFCVAMAACAAHPNAAAPSARLATAPRPTSASAACAAGTS